MPVLHAIYTHACYHNEAFISNRSASGLWTLFVEIFASVYCSFPDVLRVDRKPSFIISAFRDAVIRCGVIIQVSGNEGHNAIGAGKRFHVPLRRVENAILLHSDSITGQVALRLAITAICDTMGPDGLVSILPIYDQIPRISDQRGQQKQSEMKSTVSAALGEDSLADSEGRVNRAFRSQFPP